MTKRGRPSRKPGIRIDIDSDMLADPAISEATIALIKLIAPRLAPAPEPVAGDAHPTSDGS